MTNKELAIRFFNGDEELEKYINLTEEEISLLKDFEWKVICSNGLKNINGGWSNLDIWEGDEL